MNEQEPHPSREIFLGDPTERHILAGQIWRHKSGGTYRVDSVDTELNNTDFYETHGVVGHTVHYTQLEQGISFPAGWPWKKCDLAFVGKVMEGGQEVEIFTLEQDANDGAGD